MTDADARVRAFYGRYARLYDLVATRTPGVGGLRTAAVDALSLSPGDTVVEMGCGTGANLPALRERVGPTGRVLGVDFTPEALSLARDRTARWPNVSVLEGDAASPPVSGPVDAVLATFVVGVLADPPSAVRGWLDLLAPDGRAALLDAASSPSRAAAPLNVAFGALVRLGNPGGLRSGASLDRLDRRVTAAHDALAMAATDAAVGYRALGFVRLTTGRRGDGSASDGADSRPGSDSDADASTAPR
ncbi:MAG: class I SAM-dependent methyltransferase [Halobacteriaceae archaeon]